MRVFVTSVYLKKGESMRTKANIKSHSLHQMLIPFPIGFLMGAFIFDILGLIYSDSNLHRTAFYLAAAGVISGVAAAVPGFIDFLYSVPPESSGKRRAVKHMAVNLTTVGLFVAAVIMRDKIYWQPSMSLLAVETAGVALLTIGGWMGGTLVNRNFMGPEHRYAGAGRWKEISFRTVRPEYEVAEADELKTDQMKLIKIRDKRIALCKTEDGYYAFDDRCTHRGGSLAGGVAICGTVHCLWHGSQFSVKTGKVEAGPAVEGVKTYPVEVRNGKVYVKLKK
jgi:nitrite reductase/ring-hydroxylating ferredoxin subunit/uncharacterized membrane protein